MIKKVYSKSKKVCKATFSLPKEAVKGAKKVALLGEFNNWNKSQPIELKKKKDGSFATTVELPAGRKYEFRYLIDGAKWENDWSADQYVPINAFGIENSVVVAEVLDAPTKKAPKKVANKVAAPKTKTKKATAVKLTKIEGIGPKIEGLLKKAGIKSFEDLAKAKVADLKKVLAAAGPRYKMHNPSTWTKQSKLAAKGEWTKLQKLQDDLKGGVAKK